MGLLLFEEPPAHVSKLLQLLSEIGGIRPFLMRNSLKLSQPSTVGYQKLSGRPETYMAKSNCFTPQSPFYEAQRNTIQHSAAVTVFRRTR